MRLAFSTNAYLKYPFDEAAARIARIGYAGPRAAGRRAPRLAGRPARRPEARRSRRRWSTRAGVLQHQRVHDERDQRPSPAVLASVVHRARSALPPGPDRPHPARASLCAELGAPHITTEPGGPLAPGQSRQQAIDLFVEVLKPLAEHAHNCGVLLLIEPEPGLLLETTDQYLEVAERLNAPSIGLNFDVGHAYCVSEDLTRAIAKLAPHIRHYHLEDIAATRVHHHLVPGTGAIDFAEVVAAIRQTGYDGWLTVELYPFLDDPDAAARQALEVLRPLVQPGADRLVDPETR